MNTIFHEKRRLTTQQKKGTSAFFFVKRPVPPHFYKVAQRPSIYLIKKFLPKPKTTIVKSQAVNRSTTGSPRLM